jgi:hypothetical protein
MSAAGGGARSERVMGATGDAARGGSARAALRLAPRARKALLTLHIGASVALIGSGAGITALSLIATGERAADANVIYGAAETLVFTLGVPLSFISLLSGIALGLGTRWGVLRHRWTAAKLALQLAIIACGGLVIRPAMESLIDGGTRGTAQWTMVAGAAFNTACAMLAVGLAVFKPGGRLRRAG